ncbi:MAG: hypothetical protein ACRC0G_15885 [Fusobacteriaceae bacterium]
MENKNKIIGKILKDKRNLKNQQDPLEEVKQLAYNIFTNNKISDNVKREL